MNTHSSSLGEELELNMSRPLGSMQQGHCICEKGKADEFESKLRTQDNLELQFSIFHHYEQAYVKARIKLNEDQCIGWSSVDVNDMDIHIQREGVQVLQNSGLNYLILKGFDPTFSTKSVEEIDQSEDTFELSYAIHNLVQHTSLSSVTRFLLLNFISNENGDYYSLLFNLNKSTCYSSVQILRVMQETEDEDDDDDDSSPVPLSMACESDLLDFENKVQFDGKLDFYWSISADSETLSARLVYSGEGYVGWGVSPSGKMDGSLAVIASPDIGVYEYDISGRSVQSVVIRPEEFRSLTNENVLQANGITTVDFTQPLISPVTGSIALSATESQYFIWAYDTSNALGVHSDWGSVSMNLGDCSGVIKVSNNSLSAVQIHGLLMAIAWIILIPLGMTIARYIKSGKNYLYIHAGIQVIATILVIAGFILALTLPTTEYDHFHDLHGQLGLFIFVALLFQILLAMIRPNKIDLNISSTVDSSKLSLPLRIALRKVWALSHRILALVLLAFAYFNIYEGLEYDSVDVSESYKKALIGVSISTAIIFLLLELKNVFNSKDDTSKSGKITAQTGTQKYEQVSRPVVSQPLGF